MAGLSTSPLHDRHAALGARFGEFGGWSMPLQYGSVVAEHRAVREAVGVFDVSHLGKAKVTGPGARAYVNRCLANDLDRIAPGQAQYTLCCDDAGGVLDDLIAYLVGDDEVFLIPNAANAAEVVRRLARFAPDGVVVTDRHRDVAVLAVQGPRSDDVLRALGLDAALPYLSFADAAIGGYPVRVCRTGYTGERGVELVCPWDAAGPVWDAVLAAGQPYGILPAGLGARDTLRTEMGYPLHGQDLSDSISPVEAGLGWAVGWDKPDFWGAASLRKERAAGPQRRLRALRSAGRSIPRPGMRVRDAAGEVVGHVTSGTFSPTLGVGIGLALLDASVRLGDTVSVAIRQRVEPFEVVKPPLVQPQVRQA